MNRSVLSLLLAVSLLPILSSSGQTHLDKTSEGRHHFKVGDAELVLGMSKADVMNAFSKGYVVRENKTKNADLLVYEENDDPKGPVLAALSFSQGRLSFANKPWLKESTGENSGAVDVGTAVYGILANFADAGETRCSLRVNHDDAPDHASRVAIVRCGQNSLAVAVTAEPGKEEAVDVQELLSEGDLRCKRSEQAVLTEEL